jgi:hypothetical protein
VAHPNKYAQLGIEIEKEKQAAAEAMAIDWLFGPQLSISCLYYNMILYIFIPQIIQQETHWVCHLISDGRPQ